MLENDKQEIKGLQQLNLEQLSFPELIKNLRVWLLRAVKPRLI